VTDQCQATCNHGGAGNYCEYSDQSAKVGEEIVSRFSCREREECTYRKTDGDGDLK